MRSDEREYVNRHVILLHDGLSENSTSLILTGLDMIKADFIKIWPKQKNGLQYSFSANGKDWLAAAKSEFNGLTGGYHIKPNPLARLI